MLIYEYRFVEPAIAIVGGDAGDGLPIVEVVTDEKLIQELAERMKAIIGNPELADNPAMSRWLAHRWSPERTVLVKVEVF